MTQWRTQSVVDLCGAMRQERDYSALPMLADALQEAGYEDEGTLTRMRANPGEIEAQRLVALVYSPESAAAVAKIERIAAALGDGAILELGDDYNQIREMNYGTLIEGANRWIDQEEWTTQHGDETWRSDFPAYAAEFWKCFEIITGRKPEDDTPSFFACSC